MDIDGSTLVYINNEIARPAVDLGESRGQLGAQPSDLPRPGWLDLPSTGSIWLPVAPLLAQNGKSNSHFGAKTRISK